MLGTSFLITAPAFADDAQLQQQMALCSSQIVERDAGAAGANQGLQAAAAKQQASAAQQQASSAQRGSQRRAADTCRISRRISTTPIFRSRPRGHPRGSIASTSQWPARSSQWKVRSASATKTRPAPAIHRSAASRWPTRRSNTRTNCALRPAEPHRAQDDRRHRSGATLGGLLRVRTGWVPA